jgi:hypothetical protein
MNVLIIGAGRIGIPLGIAARNAGHDVCYLMRKGSRNIDRVKEHNMPCVIDVDTGNSSSFDAVILAANFTNNDPALLDNQLEMIHEQVVALNKSHTRRPPILSVMSHVPLSNLKASFEGFPTARFFCSSAVVEMDSIKFFETGTDEEAYNALTQILPSKRWDEVDKETFLLHGKILCQSALLCSVIAQAQELVPKPDTHDSQELLLRTIKEAELMIRANGGSAGRALFSATTPNGTTVKSHNQCFLRELDSIESG